VLVAVLFVLAPLLTPLVLSWLVNVALLVVVVTDERSSRRAQAA
jgi:hypothetical protein